MYEHYTDRARRAIVLAQEVAQATGYSYIGTEHLLHGLLSERSPDGTRGIAGSVLRDYGLTPRAVLAQLVPTLGHRTSGHIPFDALAKLVLEQSRREALQLGHNYIGTEHILLALIWANDDQQAMDLHGARRIIKGFESDLDKIRTSVIDAIKAYSSRKPGSGDLLQTAVDCSRALTDDLTRLADEWQAPPLVTVDELADIFSAFVHMREQLDSASKAASQWIELIGSRLVIPQSTAGEVAD